MSLIFVAVALWLAAAAGGFVAALGLLGIVGGLLERDLEFSVQGAVIFVFAAVGGLLAAAGGSAVMGW